MNIQYNKIMNQVYIKTIRSTNGPEERSRYFFYNEVRTLQELPTSGTPSGQVRVPKILLGGYYYPAIPNIPQHQQKSEIGIPLEKIEGEPLEHIGHQFSIKELCQMGYEIGNFISTTSRVHGDLHPGNILITPNKQIVLIDWESSAYIGENRPTRTKVGYQHPFVSAWINLAWSISPPIPLPENIRKAFPIRDIYPLTLSLFNLMYKRDLETSPSSIRRLLKSTYKSGQRLTPAVIDKLAKQHQIRTAQEIRELLDYDTQQDFPGHPQLPPSIERFFNQYLCAPYDLERYNWQDWLDDLNSALTSISN